MQSAEGQKAKLTRIRPSLKGGIIMKTTSREAIYLLAGCICNSCRAGGQQEGLQYNGEAAGWKVTSDIL